MSSSGVAGEVSTGCVGAVISMQHPPESAQFRRNCPSRHSTDSITPTNHGCRKLSEMPVRGVPCTLSLRIRAIALESLARKINGEGQSHEESKELRNRKDEDVHRKDGRLRLVLRVQISR